MMNVLIVRTSSMGDLIHTWPAVTELKTHYPNIRISWLAEESFADIARLHPAVDEVIPLAWRRWRKQLFRRDSWREMAALHRALSGRSWDLALDSQGLLKSAIPARLSGAPLAGLDWRSSREPLASLLYDKKVRIDRRQSALERNRQLFGSVFGYTPAGAPRFGVPQGERPSWLLSGKYAVLLHATSRASKEWPERHWLELGRLLAERHDMVAVLPWGNEAEKQRAERLASAMPAAVAAPRISLKEAAGLLAHASAVVGVDTGLVHLANAFEVPLVGIYTDTDPALTGVVATPWACNVGGIGQCPDAASVLAALLERKGMA